jgi:hypothetical protein
MVKISSRKRQAKRAINLRWVDRKVVSQISNIDSLEYKPKANIFEPENLNDNDLLIARIIDHLCYLSSNRRAVSVLIFTLLR